MSHESALADLKRNAQDSSKIRAAHDAGATLKEISGCGSTMASIIQCGKFSLMQVFGILDQPDLSTLLSVSGTLNLNDLAQYYDSSDFKKTGKTYQELQALFTAQQIKDAYTATQLASIGVPYAVALALRTDGSPPTQLYLDAELLVGYPTGATDAANASTASAAYTTYSSGYAAAFAATPNTNPSRATNNTARTNYLAAKANLSAAQLATSTTANSVTYNAITNPYPLAYAALAIV